MRFRPHALVSVVMALAWLLPSTAHGAAGTEYVGVNAQPMVKLLVVPPERWDTFIARLAADGMTTARFDAAWAWAEPKEPAVGTDHSYDWNPAARPNQSLDRIVAAFARHGIRMSAALTTAPKWAGSGRTWMLPEHYQDFADFSGAFAARYGSRGTFWDEHPELPRKPVVEYGVWSEANASSMFWTSTPNPAEYVKALKLVSPAVRAADPAGQVLASIGWIDFENFVGGLYDAGIEPLIDGYSFHPYAPSAGSIIDLVRRMRALTVARGDGDVPLHITEIGQPADLDGAGSDTATSGKVSDAARAATHALAAEALVRSDCGTTNYLMYALVGSESAREPIDEGYMGIYRVADAAPTRTASAVADVGARWLRTQKTPLRICGGSTGEDALLPLTVTYSRPSASCISTLVSFRGNPLEGARLEFTIPEGLFTSVETDARGRATRCVPDGYDIPVFDVAVRVTGAARSQTLQCDVRAACRQTRPAPLELEPDPSAPPAPPTVLPLPVPTSGPGGGSTPGTTTGAPASCLRKVQTRFSRVRGTRVRLTGRLRCGAVRIAPVRFDVFVQRKGKSLKSRKRLRRVTLRRGKTIAFHVRVRLRRGDRIVVVAPRTKTTPRFGSITTITSRNLRTR